MAISKDLSRFTRDALIAGKSRAEITQALSASGWAESEVKDALNAYADTPFAIPVPRPQPTVSARDFFVYTLTFGVMIFGAIYLVVLCNALIDLWLGSSGYRPSRRIRWAMAVLIVATPIFLWLNMRDRKAIAADPARYRSLIRRWLTYLTLLCAASALMTQMIVVIYSFLDGDFNLQFALKALVVFAVAGGVFSYYLSDIRKGDAA
jgi:hypothetical protein